MFSHEANYLIKSDLFRYYKSTGWKDFCKAMITEPGMRYSYLLRKCQVHHKQGNRLMYYFYRFFLLRMTVKYGISIPSDSQIGPGLYICHFGGIFINSNSVIGSNCNINQGVTIGQTNRGARQGTPTIGNQCWLGAHCVVVGKITIGNNVLIAPGATVNFDVPDNAVVAGNPGKIVSYKGTAGYVNNIWTNPGFSKMQLQEAVERS